MRHVEPYPYVFQMRMKPVWAGCTLLDLYVERFPYYSVNHWKTQIEKGNLRVNGKAVGGDTVPRAGDLIEHLMELREEPPVPSNIEILFESNDLLVVFKPAPMAVHPSGRFHKNSLIYILEERGYKGLYLTHRLDLLTSGIVVLAKNVETATRFSKAFEEGLVQKKYLARVEGEFWPEIVVCAPIRRARGLLFECHAQGREAVTEFTRKSFDGEYSVVECRPLTGRTHQIRLHLAACGFPICDDPYYNPGVTVGAVDFSSAGAPISLLACEYRFEDMVFALPAHRCCLVAWGACFEA